jgi:hypothetical protein
MIVSHTHRFVFVHIHKTAGESITHALAPHLHRSDVIVGGGHLGDGARLRRGPSRSLVKHSNATEISNAFGSEMWKQYFTFSVVRDPIDRELSLYYYYEKLRKMRSRFGPVKTVLYTIPGLRRSDPMSWPGMRAYLESASFSEFIRHPQLRQDRSAQPQRAMIVDSDGAVMVDFVARYETLDRDFAVITDRTGLTSAALGWRNASSNRVLKVSDVSDEDRRYLRHVYADDFDLLYPDE